MLFRLGPEAGESGWRDCRAEPRYCPKLSAYVEETTSAFVQEANSGGQVGGQVAVGEEQDKKCRTVLTVYRLGDLIPSTRS